MNPDGQPSAIRGILGSSSGESQRVRDEEKLDLNIFIGERYKEIESSAV